MTFTKTIARKHAEAARRRAREIEATDEVFLANRTEHTECVAIWNAFCVEETARLGAPKPRTYAAILPGVFVKTT